VVVKEDNVLRDKSYGFALRIVKAHHFLTQKRHEYILSKQLLRAGTSIGANVEEAIGGHSEKDFAWKLGLAYREARETHYWIRLLRDSEFLTPEQAESLLADAEELLRIMTSILKTIKSRGAAPPNS